MTAPARRWSWNWRGCFSARCADRALDPLRALEQRGDRPQRSARLRRRSARRCRARNRRRDPASIRSRSWLGMIQHDMMLFDHGMPRADGTMAKEQRPEADVNIEFQSRPKLAEGGAETRLGFLRRQRKLRDRLSGGRGAAHDQHRLHAVHGSRAGDQRARERARHRRSAPAGTRSGTSPPMCTRPTATGFPARIERRADHARRDRAPHRRDAQLARGRLGGTPRSEVASGAAGSAPPGHDAPQREARRGFDVRQATPLNSVAAMRRLAPAQADRRSARSRILSAPHAPNSGDRADRRTGIESAVGLMAVAMTSEAVERLMPNVAADMIETVSDSCVRAMRFTAERAFISAFRAAPAGGKALGGRCIAQGASIHFHPVGMLEHHLPDHARAAGSHTDRSRR